MIRMLWNCAFTIATCALAGCGSNSATTAPDEKQRTLEEVSGLFQLWAEQGKGPPKKTEDLWIYENAYPIGYAAIRSGDVVVNWGANSTPDSNAVLAYRKDVPSGGGWVLLQNGNVKQMTADEFKAAPKAR